MPQVDLKRGYTVHCDACRGSVNGRFPDGISGQKFGLVTALYSTDKRAHNSVVWYCKCDCGNYCYKSRDYLVSKHKTSCGCAVSFGEMTIRTLLDSLGIEYQTQKMFPDCVNPKTNAKLKFDFYLPEFNICIEYDGKQHFRLENTGWNSKEEDFKNRQFRDSIKNQYCQKEGIALIRIPYWDYNKLDEQYLLEKIEKEKKCDIQRLKS